MSKEELNNEMSQYVAFYRYYQRLIAIKFITEGHTIQDAANLLNISYPTVHRWAKSCEMDGLDGLKPSFGGGRPSKFSYEQQVELDNIIVFTNNLLISSVQQIMFGINNVEYRLKQIGVILW
ncbi:helix-turn-helix domain-containing protein [Methanobrevibacter oralis]|uniref:helix-turn-helix domain-containing protein n=1 Tax=Methanobrevibacter oralis TaxID=66851 RepID=UPI00164EBD13|nr:helix-turn-helix domain-containing protein [Methanobrevibacter oralis]